jgi:GcrA cell cycle regulator
MHPIGPGWTPERVELLKTMHAEGASGGEMARALEITRNAVIGKSHRLGLFVFRTVNGQRARTGVVAKRKSGKGGKSMKSENVTDAETRPTNDPVGIVKLEHWHCRWPVDGEGAETLYCGAAKTNGSSYCGFHWRKARGPAMRPRAIAAVRA